MLTTKYQKKMKTTQNHFTGTEIRKELKEWKTKELRRQIGTMEKIKMKL